MKHRTIISILLSVSMCMSMIMSPISVIADETSATSETQNTEETEKKEPKETKTTSAKETEKQKPTETDKEKPVETKKQKPDETKATSESTQASETEKTIETETTETIKETEQSESAKPAETSLPSESSGASDNIEKSEAEDIKETESGKETENDKSSITKEPEVSETAKRRANAESISNKCGENLTWFLDGDVLTIVGSGKMYDYTNIDDDFSPWSSERDKIKSLVFSGNITSIGDNAFDRCEKLTNVTIPNSVTSIGHSAFWGCGITSITIPSSVTTIGDYAFEYSELQSIVISNGVSSIGGKGVFSYCKKLTCVSLPKSFKVIGHSMFKECTSLSTITIPDSVTSIGERAFEYTGITSIVIPSNVTSISYNAFFGCWNLQSVTIPDSVTSIGETAFYNCKKLSSITLPKNLTTIEREAFRGCISLENITIPKGVKSIGIYSFYGCSALTSVKICEGVEEIDQRAFDNCSNLTSIELPNSLKTISYKAFNECIKLGEVTIPKSVTLIDTYAFYGCTNLASVTIDKTLYEACDSSVFEDCPNVEFHFYSGENVNSDTEVAFINSSYNVAVGKKITLKASGASDITYKTSNSKIAKVSTTGIVTALKAGTVTITAYSKSNPSNMATCKVIVKYKLNYVLNGGANSAYNLEWYTGKFSLKNPTRLGYIFKGWYTNAKFKNKSKVTSVKNANKTVYAKWAAITYKVRYNKNGGSGSQKDQSCKYGTGYKIASNKYSRKGYSFAGWNTKADGSGQVYKPGDAIKNLTAKNGGVVTLYAQWSLNTYKITYSGVPEGITNNNKTSYTVTTPTFTLEAPSTRENYTFKYWFVNVKKKVKKKTTTVEQKITSIAKGSTGNKTIYAKWALNAYTIKFNANGGTGKMDNQSCNVTKEYKIRANAFSRKGWTFTGWNTKSDGSGTSYANSQSIMDLCTKNGDSIVLYAQWKINEYTITYNVQDGTVNNNKTTFTIETDTFELTAPSRPGYTFQYWYINVKKTKKVKKKKKTVTVQQKITSIPKGSTGNKTIYAKWSANKYNIIFQSNGGTGKMNSITNCVYGKVYTLPKNTFKAPEGYEFDGWNTENDGSGTSFSNMAQISNLTTHNGNNVTLYAQWKLPYKLCWPVPGHTVVNNKFHDQINNPDHAGLDIREGNEIAGATVVAAYSGVVYKIYRCPNECEGEIHLSDPSCHGFGTGLVIRGDDNRLYVYGHMQAGSIPASFVEGQTRITKGQSIGKVGTTGNSTGYHLHFQVNNDPYDYWTKSLAIDPTSELPPYIYNPYA